MCNSLSRLPLREYARDSCQDDLGCHVRGARCLMIIRDTTTMRKAVLLALPLFAVAIAVCARDSKDLQPETIIALERAALDRWGNGDPHGYLEAYSPDVTYFDPSREKRVDGLGAMKELLI